MKKLNDYITVIVFFILISVFGAGSLLSGGASQGAAVSSAYDAEELVRGGFPLGEKMKTLYTRCARLLGQDDFFGIYYDEKGGRLIDVFGSFNSSKAESAVEALGSFRERYEDLPMYALLIPTASGIYRENLPYPLGAADQQKLIDELYYQIDAEITPIDVWGMLYQVRDNYIYYRTDDRWTQQGAYAAYAACIPKLGGSLYSVSNYDVEYTHVEFYGDLSQRSGLSLTEPDRINAYRCKFGSYVVSCDVIHGNDMLDERTSVYSRSGLQRGDKYSFFLGDSDCKSAYIRTTAEGMPKLLVIGSDYANCFLPFLAPHYSEIMLVSPPSFSEGETLSDFADPEDYDQVLFLYDIRSFCDAEGLDSIN